MKKYKFYRQLDNMDCGPTCLKMIAAHHGKKYTLDYLRTKSSITRGGVTLLSLSSAAEEIGFKTLPVKITVEQLISDVPLPCILHWNQNHFVVLYSIDKTFSSKVKSYIIADPSHGLVKINSNSLIKSWTSNQDRKGIALLLEPTTEFHNENILTQNNKKGFRFLYRYLLPYKRYFFQIIFGMLASSSLLLAFPFLTQSLVDHGIQRHNYTFIHLILFAQLTLFIGNTSIEIIRNWIIVHINTRISLAIISDFLLKLMRLPINFFETKNIGDITQRINDHKRIETFLTGSTLTTAFSLINLIVFSLVLGTYNFTILAIFLIGSSLSISWIFLFLNRRKSIDYMRFQRLRENQNSLYEMIVGMPDIKLNNCESTRRWDWERIQSKLFDINLKGLALEQYQEVGYSFINQVKNIFISYLAAVAVINNEITIGTMLSISYIVGQMNGPLSQIIFFIRSIQDAKISLERLSEIHGRPNEEVDENEQVLKKENHLHIPNEICSDESMTLNNEFKQVNNESIQLNNVSFRYGDSSTPWVLRNVTMQVPEGKVTAIVGASGSGKTTLLKLLLKFYPPTEGNILVNNISLESISARDWRRLCGTVMQDGYIFSDTITRNIAVDSESIDGDRLIHSIQIANINDFIHKLPLGLDTKIGSAGVGLSGGQRQRFLIARAVYKNPKYLFFDEATSALDANNEKIIMENLDRFFKGRTVVVIAHRLSTVKNADQIVVMENGEIKEIGNHSQLVSLQGRYFELVRNQLDLEIA